MAIEYDDISSIDSSKGNFTIRGRIIRNWSISYRTTEIDEVGIVIMDENGIKIEGRISKDLIRKLSNHVTEGVSCAIKNFNVIRNLAQGFRYTRHEYKIKLTGETFITSLEDTTIPRYGFEFKSYAEIKAKSFDANYLVDVIGHINGMPSMSFIEMKDKCVPRIDFNIRNENNHIIGCSLWERFATDLHEFIEKEGHHDISVILQFAKVKIFHGKAVINNAKSGTRMILDQNCEEVVAFNKRCDEAPVQPVEEAPIDVCGDYFVISQPKSLDEIVCEKELSFCSVVARIVDIDLNTPWCYDGCTSCKRKVKFDGDNYWCKFCSLSSTDSVQRYKLQIKVEDSSGSASFVIFEADGKRLFSKSAAQLWSEYLKQSDTSVNPLDFDVLKDKTFLFAVEVAKYNLDNPNRSAFGIKQLTDDVKMIDEFTALNNPKKATDDFEDKFKDSSMTESVVTRLGKHGHDIIDLGSSDELEDGTPTPKRHVTIKIEQED